MLVLKRKDGQWVEVLHHSGDLLRFRVYGICSGYPGRLNIAFEDDARNFEIRRPERRRNEEAVAQSPLLVETPALPQAEGFDSLEG